MDIDFFKRINDTYGHNTGDAILKSISKIILTQVRTTDIVARWGGEEFAYYQIQHLQKAIL
jgi:diguanylate cyclase (GGDEF)-like protein